MEMVEEKVGFVCGTFDLVHPGQVLMFEECKNYCDYLIVGVCVDANKMQAEKNKPIETIFERFTRLRAIKDIDEVWPYENEHDLKTLMSFLKGKYGDNLIRFVDEKYKANHYDEFDLHIKPHFTNRNHQMSSTNLRKRIYEAGYKKAD